MQICGTVTTHICSNTWKKFTINHSQIGHSRNVLIVNDYKVDMKLLLTVVLLIKHSTLLTMKMVYYNRMTATSVRDASDYVSCCEEVMI